MNPDVFFRNFELFADAPNGVQKLRELILQLAVMGKLVQQDPDDEPTSVLLEKIEAEKKKLIKEKKLRKEESLPSIKSKDVPLELPKTWKWVYLRDIGQIVGGGTPTTSQPDYFSEDGIAWLTPADLYNLKEKFVLKGRRDLSELGLKKSSAQLMPAGTVLFSSRAPIGYVAIAATDLATNQGFKSCIPFIMEMNEFIYYFLKHAGKEIDQNASGTTFKEVSGKVMSQILFPLPPLTEQKRIVSKVDELMALCDKLEARRLKKQEIQSKLNSAALERMLGAENQEEFEQYWRRICENFGILYDNPENVEKLKQAILQLAVQGKLVPQNPEDEPARVLIEKIETEREKFVTKGEIKKSKAPPLIEVSEMPYELPEAWEWVRIDKVAKNIEYGTSEKASEIRDGIPVLRMNNVQSGKITYDDLKYVPESIKDLPRLFLKHNDLLFNRTNSYELVGKTGIFKGEDDTFTLASYLIRVSLFNRCVIPDFVNMSLNSNYFRKTQIEPEITQQCGQANFNGTKLKNNLVPLPPLEEQKRIVEKVEQFMGLCNELEAKLRKSREDSEKLMEAVVKELLEWAAAEI